MKGRVARAANPDSEPECRRKALDLLARRSQSAAELSQKLERRGFSPEVRAATIRRLRDDGDLREAAAARGFAASRQWHYGRSRLRRELTTRGFSPEEISAALADITEDTEREAFERLWQQKRRSRNTLAGEKEKVRIARFLLRRGFPASLIRAALDADARTDI